MTAPAPPDRADVVAFLPYDLLHKFGFSDGDLLFGVIGRHHLTLPAGWMSMHSDLLLHGSEPNQSTRRRCGLTLRYIPTTTRIMMSKAQPFLLRGEAVEGINHYLTPPKFVVGAHMPFRGWERWQ